MKAVARLRAPREFALPVGRLVMAAAAAPLLLVLFRLLPADGAGLALRLAAAGACVLVVPGALVLRAVGWPRSIGVAVAGSVALSLALLFGGFALAFAVDGSLWIVVAVLAVAAGTAIVPAARAGAVELDREDRLAALGVLLAGVLFAAAVWWAAPVPDGDGLFHLARARKLAELDVLSSVNVVNEFRDGGPHPGYAFPLWHGALALIALLAGVDTTETVVHLTAVLCPLAFLVAYGAGSALFRSWAGGAAALAAEVGVLGFPNEGVGTFRFLALPPTTTRLILVPAALALVFALVHTGAWRLLVPLAAAALAIAVVHPSYAVFVAVPLGGFLVARFLLAPRDRTSLVRIAAALAAIAVPAGLFFVWLLPFVQETAAHTPTAEETRRSLEHYAGQVEPAGDGFRLAPEALSRAGPIVVAALLAIPLAGFATRRLWAALVLGGSLVILALLLVSPLFERLSDAVSLSQSRRLAGFLPLPFALAGGATVLGRLRLAGVAAALAAGIVLAVLYPGEFTYRLVEGGPAWPVWVAIVGGAAALAAGIVLRRHGPETGAWAAAAALVLVAPVGVSGLAGLERDAPDPNALTPGLVAALDRLEPRDIVFTDLAAAYRVAAFAPVYVNAAPPAHVAATERNRPHARRNDVIRFFYARGVTDEERRALLAAYDADWLLVNKTNRYPQSLVRSLGPVYEDERYALYRLAPR